MQIDLKNIKNQFDNRSIAMDSLDPTQRAWIEVSGAAIESNVKQIRNLLKKDCKLMAVVKADGYGHDAIFVSKYAIRGGADHLGVATLSEGISLRNAGIKKPVLVLGNIYSKRDLLKCFQYDLMPTISSLRECFICNNIGKKYQKEFPLHLKVDTGMCRLGFELKEFIDQFNKIKSCENILIKGIYSHLALADEINALDQNSFTQIQKNKFQDLLKKIKIFRHPGITTHLANSAGTLLSQDLHFDMVRVGLSMYGYNPLINSEINISLQPALFLKSKVTFIRSVKKNTGVSYGSSFITKRDTKLAVVSIGYADGINRKLSNIISVIHDGKTYQQVGSITMDQLMIDITDSNDIKVGDTVILLGKDGDKNITPIDWALKSSSITWEILCAFKNRLPRVKVNRHFDY